MEKQIRDDNNIERDQSILSQIQIMKTKMNLKQKILKYPTNRGSLINSSNKLNYKQRGLKSSSTISPQNGWYSRGGNSGNACFVSFCGICVCILISGVLHVMPYVWQCQNFWILKNPSLTAEIITILVRMTISELYQFFSPDSCCKVLPWPGPFFCPQGPRSLVYRPLLVLWHGGQALQGLQVMCVESGALGQG